jgi:RNA polymerase sigma-70 factor (sigma-E family)
MQDWTRTLTELVDRRGGALVRYAALLSGDPAEAEDLVQDALVRTFASASGRRADVEDAEAYVRRAILNTYLDAYRRRQRWVRVRHLLGRPDHAPATDVEGRADLDAALAQLPPRQRACVLLRYYADMPLAAVAVEMGVTVGTVKRHLHDATTRLGGLLEPATTEGETP